MSEFIFYEGVSAVREADIMAISKELPMVVSKKRPVSIIRFVLRGGGEVHWEFHDAVKQRDRVFAALMLKYGCELTVKRDGLENGDLP